jgi:PPOX class probable F420-dependent enzyme
MTTLEEAVALAEAENGLAIVSTVRADATVQASLVNVTYGKDKLANLRARPQLAVTFRDGWRWATVEGRAELAGPDDSRGWLADADQLRLLIRQVYSAAGGTHDDWDEFDRVMAAQRRTVVLVEPTRVYSNG